MSWDVSIEYTTCEDVRNVTYNNSGIFYHLGVHPKGKEDLSCEQWATLIQAALLRLQTATAEELDELKALEPPNKWGGLDDSKAFLEKLLEACRANPQGKVRWS